MLKTKKPFFLAKVMFVVVDEALFQRCMYTVLVLLINVLSAPSPLPAVLSGWSRLPNLDAG